MLGVGFALLRVGIRSQEPVYIINMPEDWKGRFGYTLEELDTKYKVDTASTFITIDHKTGERHNAQISAKLPTPEELMHRPYGGIRMNAEDGDENE